MRKLAHPDLGWEVLTQAAGEVLTAEAHSPGLCLGLLGVPPGFAPRDAEGWLYDVAGVTHESSATRPSSRPIPALLDHALTGLLFSHGELWDRPGGAASCSYAFTAGRGEIGFGWVGEARVSVWVDGEPRQPRWVTLRDDRGGEAHAWSIPEHHDVQVRISWCRSAQDPAAGGAEVEASWVAAGADGGVRPFPEAGSGFESAAGRDLAIADDAPGGRAISDEASSGPVPVEVPAAQPPHAAEVVGATAPLAGETLPDPGTAAAGTGAADVEAAPPPRVGFLRRLFAPLLGLGRRRGKSLEEQEEEIWGPDVPPAVEASDAAPAIEVSAAAPAVEVSDAAPTVEAFDAAPTVEASDAAPTVEVSDAARSFEAAHAAASHPPTDADTDADVTTAAAPSSDPDERPVPLAGIAGAPADPADDPAAAATTAAPVEPSDAGELIPPTPEPAVAERDDAPPPAIAPGPELFVTTIPPTPEPPELARRAIGWAAAEDPRAIDLPADGAASREPAPAEEPPFEEDGLRLLDILPYAPVTRGVDPPAPPVAPPPASPPIVEEALIEPDDAAPVPVVVADAPEPSAPTPPIAGAVVVTPRESAPAAEPGIVPTPEELAALTGATPEPVAPAPAAAPTRTGAPPQRPAWPSAQELSRPRGLPGRRHGLWIALVGALFAGGWLVGAAQDEGHPLEAGGRGPLGRALRAVGLAGPRFVVQINSRPPGAWIAVDGEAQTLRTPAAIELPPGEHTIGLSFSEFGGAQFPVRGRQGERVPLDATLWGALEVFSPSGDGVVAVAVDGVPRGFAPLRVDSLDPGVHEVVFSGPDMVSWGQTVDIRVGETRELLTRAVASPSSGVLQVEATFTDELGTQPLRGAQVWIDGELRGTTPLTLDLPRGPHSVRLAHKGQEAAIQVIDLPGGNQRFAVFELGMDRETPRLTVDVPARIPRDRPAVLSATVVGIAAADVREMWLHARVGEAGWRRYPMTLLRSPSGAAGAVAFPAAAFDAEGRARYYVSAQTAPGDEIFTEIRGIQLEGPAGR